MESAANPEVGCRRRRYSRSGSIGFVVSCCYFGQPSTGLVYLAADFEIGKAREDSEACRMGG